MYPNEPLEVLYNDTLYKLTRKTRPTYLLTYTERRAPVKLPVSYVFTGNLPATCL